MKVSSIVMCLFLLCSFLDFLILCGEFQVNFVKGVFVLCKQCILLKNFDVDEMVQLLEVIDDDLFLICDWVIMELMYGVGLCLVELVLIDIKDVNLSEGEICVIGKGNKECKVWFVGQV